jgi:CBS domain/BON domain
VAGGGDRRDHACRRIRKVARQEGRRSHDNGRDLGYRRDVSEIAALFERKRIKRVPVVKDGKLVGIVSRSNLIQALASVVGNIDQHDETDRRIRLDLLSRLREQSWTDFGSRNITVSDRVVHLWGLVGSEAERKALLALAEGVPGVSRVSDEMIQAY